MTDNKTETGITVMNQSTVRLLFSDFNAGDNFAPFNTAWVEAGSNAVLKTGDFKLLGVGIQSVDAGPWIGGDPADKVGGKYVQPGGYCSFDGQKKYYMDPTG